MLVPFHAFLKLSSSLLLCVFLCPLAVFVIVSTKRASEGQNPIGVTERGFVTPTLARATFAQFSVPFLEFSMNVHSILVFRKRPDLYAPLVESNDWRQHAGTRYQLAACPTLPVPTYNYV